MFSSRIYPTKEDLPNVAKSSVHLFFSNNEVEEHNQERMLILRNCSPAPRKITSTAQDKLTGLTSRQEQNQQILANLASLKVNETQGLPSTVTLQIGIRYMITINIDVGDGLFNGASGILREFTAINEMCTIVWIEFDDKKIGNKLYIRYFIIKNLKNNISFFRT